MIKKEHDILDKDIPNLIRKLIGFLGSNEVQRSIDKYDKNLESSGPIFREYYLKHRHPWWATLPEYDRLEKSGKAIYKNVTPEIALLAADAKKISILQRGMTDGVRREFRARLLDDDKARACLYELDIAWHFYLKGHHITWYDDSKKRHAEFCVKTDTFEFDVECKRVSVDASRKVRRSDFYRFSELLFPEIEKRGLSGRLEVVLNGRLHSNNPSLFSLRDEIIHAIEANLKGTHVISDGEVTVDLESRQNRIIDFIELSRELMVNKPHNAHGAIFAKSCNGKPADPLEMICRSKGPDRVLEGIRKKLSEASSEQLDTSRPGLLTCYLEGIDDFTELASGSGLQYMTYDLFKSDKRNHIAAVVYSSEHKMSVGIGTKTSYNQGLIFYNNNCRFPNVAGYKFLSKAVS